MAGLQQQQLAVWVWQVAARVSIWGQGTPQKDQCGLLFYPYCNAMSTVRSCCVPNLCSLHASACIMCSVACGSLSNICWHTYRLCHCLHAMLPQPGVLARPVGKRTHLLCPCHVHCTCSLVASMLLLCNTTAVSKRGCVLCSLMCAEFCTTRARVSAKDSRASS